MVGQAKFLIGTSSWAPRPRDLAPLWLSSYTCYVYFIHRSGTAVAIVEITLRTSVYKIIVYKAHLIRYIRRYSSPGTCTYCVSAVDGILPDILFITLLCYSFSYLFNRI